MLSPEIEKLSGRFSDLAKALRIAALLDSERGPLVMMDLAPEETLKVRLYFSQGATAEQRVDVQNFVRDWDWRPRKVKKIVCFGG